MDPYELIYHLRASRENERFMEANVGAPGSAVRQDAKSRGEALDEAIKLLHRFNDITDARDEYRDLLKDLLDLEAEYENIGIQHDYRERRQKAIRAAWEKFEP